MHCEHCLKMPFGFTGGHPFLSPVIDQAGMTEAGTLFDCLVCGARWDRQYDGDGGYTWKCLER